MTALVSISELASQITPSVAPPADFGSAPQLVWLPIADLVVDPDYQRPIGATGRLNIAAIVGAFVWSQFSAVIVAPVEGGGYAIVDGQHRTIAAHLAGIERVPCQIIQVGRAGQARAFTAINGRVTRMSSLALHKAAVAGGDPRAVAIERVATAADVRIMRYPKTEMRQEPGETMAISVIAALIDAAGEDVAALSLAIIRASAGTRPGCLLAAIIKAVGERVREMRDTGQSLGEITTRFRPVDLVHEYGKARMEPTRPGEALWMRLLARLRLRVG